MNKQGRPTQPAPTEADATPETISGDRGLDHEEPLIFEIGRTGMTGVDLPDVELEHDRLGGLRRTVRSACRASPSRKSMRHYVRLSQQNYAIDAGLYPLGSCTMKHNPRLNEKMARLPGFADLHPLQPRNDRAGRARADRRAGALADRRSPACRRSRCRPKAGAHGELCGLLAIRAALEARGEKRHAHAGAGIRARHQPGDRRARRLHRREVPANDGRPRRSRRAEGEARPRRRRASCSPTRTPAACSSATSSRSPTRCTRRAPISTATAPTSTPSSAACGRAISASTPCTSTCTRPSRRRMAAAGRARGRWCSRQRSRPSRRCRSSCTTTNGFELIEDDGRRRRRTARRLRPHVRLPRPDGHVHARADLHAEPRRRRPAQVAEDAVLNANYILASLKDVMSAPFGEARACTRRCSTTSS